MKRKIIFSVIVLIFSINGFSQESLSPADIEKKSLQLYETKNWKELIPFVNQALAEGNDYFYLRMRIGIAYYELKNYTKAEPQFIRALNFNSSDQTAQEYLYYSYIFNEKYAEARTLSFEFSDALLTKTGAKKYNSITMAFVEGGTKISDSAKYYNKNTNSKSNYFGSAVYIQAGLLHYVGKHTSLLHAVTYFNQASSIGTITQFQYYINAGVSLKNNWQFSPSFHWMNLGNSTQITIAPPFTPPGLPPQQARTQTVKTVNNYFVGSFELSKRMSNLTLSVGTTVSNMNNKTQLIHSGSFSVNALGNSNLIFGLSSYIHSTNGYSTINTTLIPFIAINPIKQLSIKLSYLTDNKENFVEQNGYLINNSPDLTTSRFSILVNGNINKKLTIYGLYQSEQKKEVVQLFKYQYAVFVAGFKVLL